MKIFIFERLDQVTPEWHPEGGLVVIAKNIEHVNELIRFEDFIEISDEEWNTVKVYELKGDVKPEIITFRDTGCC